jgi:hypothetical protein
MSKAPPLPELYKMYPPFPDMDEKKILVSSSTGSAVGQLVTNWQVSEGLFGVRIEFANPTVYGPHTLIPFLISTVQLTISFFPRRRFDPLGSAITRITATLLIFRGTKHQVSREMPRDDDRYA